MNYEAHITCERIAIEDISPIAAEMRERGFRTGDLLLHLNSFDLDAGSACKSFFSAKHDNLAHLRQEMKDAIAVLRGEGVKVTRAKIEHIIQDERF